MVSVGVCGDLTIAFFHTAKSCDLIPINGTLHIKIFWTYKRTRVASVTQAVLTKHRPVSTATLNCHKQTCLIDKSVLSSKTDSNPTTEESLIELFQNLSDPLKISDVIRTKNNEWAVKTRISGTTPSHLIYH